MHCGFVDLMNLRMISKFRRTSIGNKRNGITYQTKMKEITIKIYGWSDLKKWFWDKFCFPRRKLVAMWLDDHNYEIRRLVEKILIKYNNVDLEKDTYALLSKALEDWDEESKKISDKTKELIMKKS